MVISWAGLWGDLFSILEHFGTKIFLHASIALVIREVHIEISMYKIFFLV